MRPLVACLCAAWCGSCRDYRATFDALSREDSPRSVAQRRNLKVSALQSRRQGVEADAAERAVQVLHDAFELGVP